MRVRAFASEIFEASGVKWSCVAPSGSRSHQPAAGRAPASAVAVEGRRQQHRASRARDARAAADRRRQRAARGGIERRWPRVRCGRRAAARRARRPRAIEHALARVGAGRHAAHDLRAGRRHAHHRDDAGPRVSAGSALACPCDAGARRCPTGSRVMMSGPSATDAAPIRVALVEDDRATREGLGLLIDGTPGYRCVGLFRSVEEALRAGAARTAGRAAARHPPARHARLGRRPPVPRSLSVGADPDVDGLRRAGQGLRIDLQRRVRLSAEEDAAEPPARRDPRGARGWGADVTGSGAEGDSRVPDDRAAGEVRREPDAAGTAAV